MPKVKRPEFEAYYHHGYNVIVQSRLKGKHREHCLCYSCIHFHPESREDNCPIANLVHAVCVNLHVTLPVWECPVGDFIPHLPQEPRSTVPQMRVYIAGPYTIGNIGLNIRRFIGTAEAVIAKGHIPFVPVLTHFWNLIDWHSWDFWLEYDLQWLPVCDAILRLSGDSKGANKEVKRARELGMPVFTDIDDLPPAGAEQHDE